MASGFLKSPKLGDFATRLKTDSISKPSRYFVEIPPPPIIMAKMPKPSDIELIGLYCEHTQFPEFALATQTSGATGTLIEMPYEKMYGPVMMSFICDRDMIVKSFFDEWTQATVNAIGGVFNYYSDYVSPEIVIYQYDENSDATYAVSLFNAYPKIVNDVPLGNNMVNDYSHCMVQFTYEHWISYRIENTRSSISNLYPADLAASKYGYLKGTSRSSGKIAEQLAISATQEIIPSRSLIPGIDVLQKVTGISNVMDAVSKMKNPKLLKDSILRSAGSFAFENMKPFTQRALESLPKTIRQIGGSAIGKAMGGLANGRLGF